MSMQVVIDLSNEGMEDYKDYTGERVADVVAVLFHNGTRLFAVTTSIFGAPWYGLIAENSTAFVKVLEHPLPKPRLMAAPAAVLVTADKGSSTNDSLPPA